jgi:NADH-quinone oxidoreductase subunit E
MTDTLITPESQAQIAHWLTKFPKERKRSALIAALSIVQAQNGGWLSDDLIEAVADFLGVPAIAAQEVVRFYTLFETAPVGKHTIAVCTNISCMLRGSDEVMAHLKQRLNIAVGETTPDGQFTLKAVECLAACVGAPMMQVGRDYHECLTPEKIDTILNQLALGSESDHPHKK